MSRFSDIQSIPTKLRYLSIITSVMIIVSVLTPDLLVRAYPTNPLPAQPGFEGGKALSGAAVNYPSPTLADLSGDGKLEIIQKTYRHVRRQLGGICSAAWKELRPGK